MATRKDRQDLIKGLAFVSPWIVGFLCFLLLPIVLSAYYSLCDYSLTSSVYVGRENYTELWHDPLFWKSLRNTLVYAAMALPAGLLVSLGLAMLLNVSIPGQPLFRTIIFLPFLAPAVASAMVWMWLLNAKYGMVNTALRTVGIPGPPWLTDASWVLPSFAAISLWGVGHTVVIYLAGLQDVPRELYEAAEIDGASNLRRLWHVTLPMLSPVIFFNLIMAIIGSLQVFTGPYLITGGGPDNASMFFTLYLYDNAFTYIRMGYASAMAWIQLVLVLALTLLAFWSGRRWVHYQGK